MDAERRTRILVPLDASPDSLAAVEDAAELAAALGAELVGLFVEEVELLELAEHPLARVLDPLTGLPAPLERGLLQRRMRAHATLVRRALEGVARRRRVEWSFRTETGSVVTSICAAATEVDFVSVGRHGWSSAGRRRLGSTARALLDAQLETVLVQGRVVPGAPVLASVTGSAAGRHALETAARIAERLERRLVVLIEAPDEAQARALERELRRGLDPDLPASFEWWPADQSRDLVQRLKGRALGMAVLSEDAAIDVEHLPELIDALECPVMFVRASKAANA